MTSKAKCGIIFQKKSVVIEGFNLIDYSAKFTPTKYVPQVVYSITPSFGSDVKSVKFDHIGSNKDLSICFTVYADGVTITDPNTVKALNPVITVSPQCMVGQALEMRVFVTAKNVLDKDGVPVYDDGLIQWQNDAEDSTLKSVDSNLGRLSG